MKVQGLWLNAQETVLIDRLVDTGLYGGTRTTVIRNMLDRQLCELFKTRRPL